MEANKKPEYDQNSHTVELDEAVYEVHRVYAGRQSAADLVRDRLAEISDRAEFQNTPLTKPARPVYNIKRGVGMEKEAR